MTMKNIKAIINWILLFGILISGPLYIFLSKNNSFIPSVYLPTIIISVLCLWIIKKKKLDLKYGIYAHLGLWLNLLGEYYFYYHWVYYDKVLHFFVPLIFTLFLYDYIKVKLNPFQKKFFILLCVLGIGALFEIFEYFQSGIFNFPSVGVYLDTELVMPPYKDTIWDLIYNSLGSLFYLFFKDNVVLKKYLFHKI